MGSQRGSSWKDIVTYVWRKPTPIAPPRGGKRDFADGERLLRRHAAGELILSFVPKAEQRLWRTMTRTKHQLRATGSASTIRSNPSWRMPASSCLVGSAICWLSLIHISEPTRLLSISY